MTLNDGHSRLHKLSSDDKEFLKVYIPKNERFIEVVTKFLESFTNEPRVNASDPNWAIKRAMMDGQEQLVESWKILFRE